MNEAARETEQRPGLSRRLASVGMVAALVAAYGTLAAFIARFLYPSGERPRSWLFVTRTSELEPGQAVVFRTPSGEPVNITRQGEGEESIVALSSTCPHLGCQVHWEPQNDRFFCPCHNGIFDPTGKGIGGPPGDAGQSLLEYPIRVADGLLYIELPTDQIALGPGRIEAPAAAACTLRPPGPGHDPCLYPSDAVRDRIVTRRA